MDDAGPTSPIERCLTLRDVLILGAGRSGTSFCAGLLAKAGYFMGDNLLEPTPENPKGYFEDREINWLNERILFPHMAIWRRIPKLNRIPSASPGPNHMWLARVPIDGRLNEGRDVTREIGALVDRRPFCFKDPRFSYTLPAWRPFLDDAVFLCVFRDPAAVIDSTLRSLNKEPYLANLKLSAAALNETWGMIYRHVMEKHRREGRWLFLHYRQLFDPHVLAKIEDFVEAEVDRSFAERGLERSSPSARVTEENLALYGALCEAASYAPD